MASGTGSARPAGSGGGSGGRRLMAMSGSLDRSIQTANQAGAELTALQQNRRASAINFAPLEQPNSSQQQQAQGQQQLLQIQLQIQQQQQQQQQISQQESNRRNSSANESQQQQQQQDFPSQSMHLTGAEQRRQQHHQLASSGGSFEGNSTARRTYLQQQQQPAQCSAKEDIDIVFNRLMALEAFRKLHPSVIRNLCSYAFIERIDKGVIGK